MNKLFTKIGTAIVGMAMAVGVGVAVGHNSVQEAKAANQTVYIDGTSSSLNITTDTAGVTGEQTVTAGGVTYKFNNAGNSTKVKTQNTGGSNHFVKDGAILIGKSGAYLYNTTALSDNISKIELYSNKGASTSVKVGIKYGASAVSTAMTESNADWSSVLSTEDSVYTVTAPTISNPKFFRFQVLSAHNAQIELKITCGEALSIKSIALSADDNAKTSYYVGDEVSFAGIKATATYSDDSTADVTSSCVITANKENVAKGDTSIKYSATYTPDNTIVISDFDLDIEVSEPDYKVGDKFALYAETENGKFELYKIETLGTADIGFAKEFKTVPSCDYVVTIAESTAKAGTYALQHDSKYLSIESDANILNEVDSITTKSSWYIEYSKDTNAAVITNANFTARTIQFNYNSGSNPRFSTYKTAQSPICLYPYTEKPLTDFSLPGSAELYVGEEAGLEVTYTPADAFDKAGIVWDSSDKTVATIDENGVITALAVGTTTITGEKTINEVKVTRSCVLTVKTNVASHEGNEADPFNVEDARYVAGGVFTKVKSGAAVNLENKYYVKGIITGTVNRTTTKLTLWIGDNAGQTSGQLGAFEIYQAGKVYGTALSDKYTDNNKVVEAFPVGSTLIVCSTLTEYNGTYETVNGAADITYSSYFKALDFANDFNTKLANICKNDNTTSVSDLATEWGKQATAFEALNDLEKAHLVDATAKTDGIKTERAAAKYDYIAGKYQNQIKGDLASYDFMGRNPAPIAQGMIQYNSTNGSFYIVAIIAASLTVSVVGTIMLLKRRKEDK